LEALSIRYGENHPEVKRTRDELARARAQEAVAKAPAAPAQTQADDARNAPAKTIAAPADLAKSRQNPERAFDLGQAEERVVSLKSNITSLDHEIEAREADEQRIQQNINVLQGRLTRLPVREQELAKIARDYEISKANYKTLLDKSLSAEMATDMEHRQKSERFTVLDPARVPEKPTKPDRPVLAGAGCLIALALGMVLSFGIEAQKGAILGEWEFPGEVAILARLPFIEVQASSALESKHGRLRVALVSSAVIFVLGAVAAGLFFARRLL
jgi:hypothetical protein